MLPTILTEETHFYKQYEKELKEHLGKPYISYSSVDSWFEYRDDFIKQKFGKIRLPDGIYATFGGYIGEAIEKGVFGENLHGFQGQENLDLNSLRPEGAEYEKLIVIDRGDYIIVGFIDIYYEKDGKANVLDLKTGGSNKESKYTSEDYIQVILYAYAIESKGIPIGETGVWFIRREGSHVKPPLKIGKEQFYIPLGYNKKRVDFALKKVDKAVKEIAELYKTYQKIFSSSEK